MWNKAKGFLIVEEPISKNGINYYGVNTNAWPIGTDFSSEVIANICEASYLYLDFPLLADFDSALHYYRSCEQIGIKPRMLFCEALIDRPLKNLPQFENPHVGTFLGFDYAYPSGDYYSAIVNDIINRDISLPTRWKHHLNRFGLLPTEDELLLFVKERALAVKEDEEHDQGILFEKGNFVEFRVFFIEHSKICAI